MKTTLKTLIVASGLLLSNYATAQAPEGVNYQATVRNSSGALMTNQSVAVIFTLKKTTTSGATVYSETQTLSTNAYGGFVAIIGQGTATSGTFAGINWGTNKHFLNVKVNGNDLGTTQLLSVPYALHAKTAEKLTKPIWKKKVSNGHYFTEGEPVIIGDSVSSARAFSVKKSSIPSSTNLVDFNAGHLTGTSEILQLTAGFTSSPTSQFIECNKGGFTKFDVKTSGYVHARDHIKTDSSLIIGKEVNRTATGSANLVPIAYGVINSSGVIQTNASTSNFTCTRTTTGTYYITITGQTFNFTTHMASISKIGNGDISYVSGGGQLRVYTRTNSGTAVNSTFSFIVYKP